jgi:hypothetical protein
MEWNSIASQLDSQPQDSDAGYRDYCIEAEKGGSMNKCHSLSIKWNYSSGQVQNQRLKIPSPAADILIWQ